MNAVFPSPLLRAGLTLDAVGSGAMALLQLLLSSTLVTWLQLPQPLVLGTGLFMLGYAALTGWMARASRLPVALVRLVVFGNLGWAAAAVLLLVLVEGVAPSTLGLAFLAVHAVSVLGFAALQGPGLVRSAPAGGRALTPSV